MSLKKPLIACSLATLVFTASPSAEEVSETVSILDYTEEQSLLFMREEEKLARDVYLTFYEQWEKPVFANIADSEQTHTDAVADKIEKYGLLDPVVDDSIGAFVNSFLLEKFYELVAKGQFSELEALMVGAFIEELDIIDLQEAIEETDESDIIELYSNLMRGSRNHLRAFVELIEEVTGEEYSAQLLDQEVVDAILSESIETGGRD
ncbi:MAG: DUF2202 domain-containing protein [Gammaproteobacteria bacterium]|jgi:hypothetical protein